MGQKSSPNGVDIDGGVQPSGPAHHVRIARGRADARTSRLHSELLQIYLLWESENARTRTRQKKPEQDCHQGESG